MMTANRQQGFSIVTAIFLIVILAALGTFMLRMSAVQSETTALSVQSARAYQAAHSGIEWGLHQAIVNDACAASTSFALAPFDITVQCSSSDHPEGGQTIRIYEITATARFGTLGEPTHVQRVIDVRAARAF
jgi:MSHA biogenesis protein MshP